MVPVRAGDRRTFWETEFQEIKRAFCDRLDCIILVISITSLVAEYKLSHPRARPGEERSTADPSAAAETIFNCVMPSLTIVDEVHGIRNAGVRQDAIRLICSKSLAVIGATATPVFTHVLDPLTICQTLGAIDPSATEDTAKVIRKTMAAALKAARRRDAAAPNVDIRSCEPTPAEKKIVVTGSRELEKVMKLTIPFFIRRTAASLDNEGNALQSVPMYRTVPIHVTLTSIEAQSIRQQEQVAFKLAEREGDAGRAEVGEPMGRPKHY